jgi:hypothetical protein
MVKPVTSVRLVNYASQSGGVATAQKKFETASKALLSPGTNTTSRTQTEENKKLHKPRQTNTILAKN